MGGGGMHGGMGGGHRGGLGQGHGSGFEHGHFVHGGFHHRAFRDGVVVVPFGLGYGYGYSPYVSSPYDTYCNPASPYYDPDVCWDYYGG